MNTKSNPTPAAARHAVRLLEVENLARRIILQVEAEARRTDTNWGHVGSVGMAADYLAQAAYSLGILTPEEVAVLEAAGTI